MSEQNNRGDAANHGGGGVDPTPKPGASRRDFLKGAASLAASAAALSTAAQQPAQALGSNPPQPPAPGSPQPWQPAVGIGHGSANLATGNALLTLPLFAWGGKTPLSFALFFNSHSTQSSPLGTKGAAATAWEWSLPQQTQP